MVELTVTVATPFASVVTAPFAGTSVPRVVANVTAVFATGASLLDQVTVTAAWSQGSPWSRLPVQ